MLKGEAGKEVCAIEVLTDAECKSLEIIRLDVDATCIYSWNFYDVVQIYVAHISCKSSLVSTSPYHSLPSLPTLTHSNLIGPIVYGLVVSVVCVLEDSICHTRIL